MATRNGKENKETQEQVENNNHSNNGSGTSYPAYLEAAARLSATRPVGATRVDTDIVKIDDSLNADAGGSSYSLRSAVPGFCVLHYLPTLGVSTTATSPLNRASFTEFNRIREKISGNRPYEPVDHMIYRQCVDAMRELYDYISRAYKIIRSYSALNLYKPRYIMEGMGLDYDDWNYNAPVVYQWLCNHKSALLPFPTVPIGKITNRRSAFNSAVFTDGDSAHAQIYIFNQIGFYSYERVDEVKGISIAKPYDGTVRAYLELWERMYAALQSSSDVYVIAADIRRAFESEVVTDLEAPAVDATIEYVKLDPVLTNIMNATTLATFEDGGDFNDVAAQVANSLRISDGGNGILWCDGKIVTEVPTLTSGDVLPAYVHTTGFLKHLNFVESNPDVNAVVNAVRFKPVLRNKVTFPFDLGTNRRKVRAETTLESMSTEVVIYARCYELQGDDLVEVAYPSTVTVYADESAKNIVAHLAVTCNFDWIFPQAFCLLDSGVTDLVEDTQNYVPISDTVLSQIHEAILLSEFGITG